jgi:hypothetical protein
LSLSRCVCVPFVTLCRAGLETELAVLKDKRIASWIALM